MTERVDFCNLTLIFKRIFMHPCCKEVTEVDYERNKKNITFVVLRSLKSNVGMPFDSEYNLCSMNAVLSLYTYIYSLYTYTYIF